VTQGARRLDVLVVDDEPALRELLVANLTAVGHDVRSASDGLEALAAVDTRRPDVVVLDVLMPRLDGWGVLEALAERPATADVPVVMLTALSGEQDVIRAHLTGAVHYVTKPFEVARLLQAVDRAAQPPTEEQRLERRRQLRAFLGRLAELDGGRSPIGPQVRFSGLEAVPPPAAPVPPPNAGRLTPRQLHVAGLLADGVQPRAIAALLGTSRSNVYATRARIARHLGTDPEHVAEVARRAGLTARTPPTPPTPADDGVS
jgi:CheY-like chemotaxis protein/DNA-binding CsgD family transcriptional regulator